MMEQCKGGGGKGGREGAAWGSSWSLLRKKRDKKKWRNGAPTMQRNKTREMENNIETGRN